MTDYAKPTTAVEVVDRLIEGLRYRAEHLKREEFGLRQRLAEVDEAITRLMSERDWYERYQAQSDDPTAPQGDA